MIVGSPDNFAIILDIVGAWNNDNSFNNGLLCMGINGELFPSTILASTLNTELFRLIKVLDKTVKNEVIYQMEKEKAFAYIFNITFPDDYEIENNYDYDITPYEFANKNYFVFRVSNGENSRILASKVQYLPEKSAYDLKDLDVIEAYISNNEIKRIIEKLQLYQLTIRRKE